MKTTFQKCMIIVFLFGLSLSLCSTIVKANSGPPSNVQITVINNEVDFYFDLLIYKETLLTQEEIDEATSKITDGDYAFYDDFYPSYLASYQDGEGYVSNTLYGSAENFYTYDFGDERGFDARLLMDIPREFKILLYTDSGVIVTSEVITMSQFDFRLTYDLDGVDMTVDQINAGVITGYVGNPWGNISTWVNFLLRLILTLVIELGVLYLFGYRKKSTFFFVTGMNVVSQIALNIAIISAFYYNPSNGYQFFFTFIIGEFFVFTIEAILVSIFVKEHKVFRKIAYSLLANTASMIIGLLVASSLSFLV